MPKRVGYAISSVDGTPIFYEDLSPPRAGELLPVVLCDGIGCSGFIWKYLQPLLAEKRHVVHWHYRGHGRSAHPNDSSRLSVADLAHDLASVLDDAGVDDAVLIGHSMGVQVSLEFYRHYTRRTRALVLMCGAHSEPLKTFKGSDLMEVALPALRKTIGSAPGFFSSLGRSVLPRDWSYRIASKLEFKEDLLSQQDFMPYLKGLAQMDPILFLSMLTAASEHSTRDLLPEIRIPTLLVAGELDTFTPPALGREMAKLIVGSELCVVRDGTHSAPLEHPDLVGEVTIDFLDRLPHISRC